ncbi:MAG: SBBP repeat-containing protein [Proteobacteria bacterium]|nr:SBBP repeat-containing protein [Pseudomonadota bacterium]
MGRGVLSIAALLALAGCGFKSNTPGGIAGGAGSVAGWAGSGGSAAGTGGRAGATGGVAGMAGLGGTGMVSGPWARRFGGTGRDVGIDVAVDPSGNVVLTGYFTGTVDFGGGPLTGPGRSILVAKFAPDGMHLWSKRFGGTGESDYGGSVATDAAGNILVTGAFGTSVDFGGGRLTSAGDRDVFVAKFSPDGGHLWSKRFGDASSDQGWSVAVDTAGSAVLTGHFVGTVDFGSGPLTSAGGSDIFVARFGSDGHLVWSTRFGGTATDAGWNLALDGLGNILLTGSFRESVDFGGGPLTSAGGSDIFAVKLGSDAGHVWSRRFGGTQGDLGRGITTDGAGNVVLTGHFHGTVDFGGGGLASAGGPDAFLVELTPNGFHLWSKRFGGFGNDRGTSVAAGGRGTALLTGHLSDVVVFGGGKLTSAGAEDTYVAKFAADSTHIKSRRFGGIGVDEGWGIAADAAGNIVFTGYFNDSADFGGGNVVSAGDRDIFVSKFTP